MAENGDAGNELLAVDSQSAESTGGKSKIGKVITVLAVIIAGISTCSLLTGPSEEEEAERRRTGEHCFFRAKNAVRDYAQSNMLDPSSYEHIGSKIYPVDQDGYHRFEQRFRDRNQLGLLGVSTATAYISQETCEAGLFGFE